MDSNDWKEVPIDEGDWNEVPLHQRHSIPLTSFNDPAEQGDFATLPQHTLSPELTGKIFETIDKYTGAPVRKFATEIATGKKLEKAPSGKEQAQMMGFSPESWKVNDVDLDISPAGAAGLALEMVQDPFLLASGAIGGVKKLGQIGQGMKGVNAGLRATQAAEAVAENALKNEVLQKAANTATLQGGEQSAKVSGDLFKFKPPQTIDEFKTLQLPEGLSGEMAQAGRLKEIENILPESQLKFSNLHKQYFENPKAMKELKIKFQNLPTESAKNMARYEQAMINESKNGIEGLIDSLGSQPAKKIPDVGRDIINSVKTKYKETQKALGPLFGEMQKKSKYFTKADAADLQIAIAENSKLSPLLFFDEDGIPRLKPNNTKTGLSSQEYAKIKDVFDDLGNGRTNFKDIQNMRESLRKAVDNMNPHATLEIKKVRSIMLNQLEEMVSKKVPEMRETFEGYAKNERALEQIEEIIGGQVESLDKMYKANPETVVGNILSDPNFQEIVGDYLGKDQIDNLVKSYVTEAYNQSHHSVNGFLPHQFKQFLKNNQKVIRNLSPEAIAKLNAWTDKSYLAKRFLDEVNPSGTAAAFSSMVTPGSFAADMVNKGPTAKISQEAMNWVNTNAKQRSSVKALNDILAGVQVEDKIPFWQRAGENIGSISPTTPLKGYMVNAPLKIENIRERENEKEKKNPDKTSILQKAKGTPYSQVLENSLRNGGDQSFAAAHYVLSQRDPNYKKALGE